VFDGYLSFKIFNKVSKNSRNMKIKEHYRQNVIKRGENNPAEISQDAFKNLRIFIHSKSQDFLFRDFSGFKILGLFSPRIL
jgi:hypothetical protein